MSKTIANSIHIVEPTLFDQTGHGYSYVQSLLLAPNAKNFAIELWIDKRGINLFNAATCVSNLYFRRKFRQLQKIFLYTKLIFRPIKIFVSTADLWDLKILNFLHKLPFTKAKIYLHFHQFKQTTNKLKALKSLAQDSEINILTPTQRLIDIFIGNGFKNCKVVPCPTFYPEPKNLVQHSEFKRVVYAGAARNDKGFPLVLELIAHLRKEGISIPCEVQISAPNSNRYDKNCQAALDVLHKIPRDNLTLHTHTLEKDQYLGLFAHSICLLLYDQSSYSDKFSGIALDAFYAGCPIITIENTWMGDVATEYKAGIALANYELTTIVKAINTIIKDYNFYHNNAKLAAKNLRKLHDPNNTLLSLCH